MLHVASVFISRGGKRAQVEKVPACMRSRRRGRVAAWVRSSMQAARAGAQQPTSSMPSMWAGVRTRATEREGGSSRRRRVACEVREPHTGRRERPNGAGAGVQTDASVRTFGR